jgi:hypothetical protein
MPAAALLVVVVAVCVVVLPHPAALTAKRARRPKTARATSGRVEVRPGGAKGPGLIS